MDSCERTITILGLSCRSSNCLYSVGIESFEQLLSTSSEELLAFRNFGKKALNEIKKELFKLGTSLNDGIRSEEEERNKILIINAEKILEFLRFIENVPINDCKYFKREGLEFDSMKTAMIMLVKLSSEKNKVEALASLFHSLLHQIEMQKWY
jgi:hypothetical protein